MTLACYILMEDGTVRPARDDNDDDFFAHARCIGTQVVEEEVLPGVRVSTIFLGIANTNPPRVWETMVFCECGVEEPLRTAFDKYQTRCAGSQEQAEAMHAEVKAMILDYVPHAAL